MKKGLLEKLFNIYPGEEKHAILFALLGYVWAFAVMCGQKFADALFLIHIGPESLPTAYMMTAFGMFGVATLLLSAFHKFSSYLIYLSVLCIGACFYLFIFFCRHFGIGEDSEWFWYVLKLSGFFFFAVLTTCYWTFIDQYHHLQDAKRLYTLFSAMIFLGTASTGLLMHSGLLELNNLLLLIVILYITTHFFVRKITREVPSVIHEDAEIEGQVYEQGGSFRFLIKSILSSPFTLLLMTSNLLMYLLLVITEYNYMYTFGHYFSSQTAPDLGGGTESSLTLFLGQCLAVVSVINLIGGLFIYSRLVRRFGISSLLIISPVLLIVAFTGWSLSDSLLFPLIGYFVVEGTLYVFDDSNFNLLLNAVPSKLKYKIRVMIESFFEPVGMLLSALMLSFFQNQSKLLGLILAIAALSIALAIQSRYLKALFFNLSDNAIHFQRTVKNWISSMTEKQYVSSENRLLALLRIGDERAQIFACEGLLAFEDANSVKRLLSEANCFLPQTKIQLLQLLSTSQFSKNTLVIDRIQSWIHRDFNSQLRGAVNFYLAKLGLLHPENVIEDLKNSDIQLRGAAILSLKKSYADLPPSTTAHNRALSSQHLKILLDSDEEDHLCMGLQILGIDPSPGDVDLLIPYLTNPSLKIKRTAANSIANSKKIDSIRQAPRLLDILNNLYDNEARMSCIKAIGLSNDSSLVYQLIETSSSFRPNERRLVEEVIYNMGLRTVPTLLSMVKDTTMPDRARMLAGRALGRLSLPQLVANLFDIINEEINRAYFYFYHSQTIQSDYPQHDLSMLHDVLMTGYHSILDFIIQLLAVAGEVEDVELLSRSLRSRNPKIRSQGVEALEKTCEPMIFRLLQPLVDDLPKEEKIRTYLKSGHQPLSLTELLDKMSQSSAQIDQIMAATIRYHLDLPNWRDSLRQQMSRQNELFHHFAYELLEL